MVLAAVGYLPMLFFLPLLLVRADPFAKFHGKQSLVIQVALFVFWIAVWVSDFLLGRILGGMLILGFIFKVFAWLIHYPAGLVVTLGYVVVAILGIVQSLAGQYWRIPVVGAYADRLAF
jgi:uncharacterized membrane protein